MQTIIRSRLIQLFLLWAGFCSTVFAISPGEPAPALELQQLGSSEQLELKGLRGKIVYVDFWASWCGPCRKSLPLYEALHNKLPSERFKILAVNLDEKVEDAERFLKRNPVSYTVLLDPSGNSAARWSVKAMPTSYLVDADGTLAFIYAGFKASHIGEIENDIKTLLDALPEPDDVGTDGMR
jgi:thiol-disulfide isomerase/thioredoxin